MSFKLSVLFLLFTVVYGNTGYTQTKVGYTNVELIMAYMPEVQTVNSQLEKYRQEKEQQIAGKSNGYQTKVNDYYKKIEANQYPTVAAKEAAEREIMKLEKEVQQLTADAERQLLEKQQELMNPIMEKIQSRINEVAEEGNFTYILNQTSGMNILYGLETMDITPQLAAKLGITIRE